jgi:hypothetical protein
VEDKETLQVQENETLRKKQGRKRKFKLKKDIYKIIEREIRNKKQLEGKKSKFGFIINFKEENFLLH